MCKLANLLVDKKVLMAEIAHNLAYLEKQADTIWGMDYKDNDWLLAKNQF